MYIIFSLKYIYVNINKQHIVSVDICTYRIKSKFNHNKYALFRRKERINVFPEKLIAALLHFLQRVLVILIKITLAIVYSKYKFINNFINYSCEALHKFNLKYSQKGKSLLHQNIIYIYYNKFIYICIIFQRTTVHVYSFSSDLSHLYSIAHILNTNPHIIAETKNSPSSSAPETKPKTHTVSRCTLRANLIFHPFDADPVSTTL